MPTSLYDSDFYAWANEQAALLREGRATDADLALIADEIESMGKSQRRAIVSRLAILILHLLKWERQPALRGASWRLGIANARDALADLFGENSSLKAQSDSLIVSAAIQTRCEILFSEDLQHGRRFGALRVMNPFL